MRAAREAVPPAPVEVLPGPTAAATAYVASGTASTAFYFGGFFPRKDKARRDLLTNLALLDAALAAHPQKVVVKRPAKGPHLADRKPDYSLAGKAVRFDGYSLAR